MAENTEWTDLIGKFISNSCTKEEFERLMALVQKGDDTQGLSAEMLIQWNSIQHDAELSPEWNDRLSAMFAESPGNKTSGRFKGIVRSIAGNRWAAAAIVVVIAGAGYLGWNATSRVTPQAITKVAQQDAFDVNRATLILADGTSIDLDSVQNGTIATQGNVKIIKGEEGEIIYYPDRQKHVATGFNTLTTPSGGRYRVVLPDGTKVWMNAASSIKFTADFVDATRNVDLSGEAYFEVTKNPEMPFFVHMNGAKARVFGTSFNIHAYSEEGNVSTTLVEGSLKVFNGNEKKEVLLKPGQQVKVNREKDLMALTDSADIDQALAWKNGKFQFVNTPVPELLREIARWYGLKVVYKATPVSRKHLTGTFSRSMKLDQLTEMLSYAGVNMAIDNDQLLILPN